LHFTIRVKSTEADDAFDEEDTEVGYRNWFDGMIRFNGEKKKWKLLLPFPPGDC
jgi:hypothetical protein